MMEIGKSKIVIKGTKRRTYNNKLGDQTNIINTSPQEIIPLWKCQKRQ